MAPTADSTGLILFAHGSVVDEANAGVRRLAHDVQNAGPYSYVRAAFLEIAQPDLATAIDHAAEAGLGRVMVLPYFLTMGIHLRRDLPNLLAPLRKKYSGLVIEVGRPLEDHPRLPELILGRAEELAADH